MAETSPLAEPVINVIEQAFPGRTGFAEQSGDDGRARAHDAAAMDAVSALRRREFDAVRAHLRDQAVGDAASTPRPASQPGTRAAPDTLTAAGEATSGTRDETQAPVDQPPVSVRKRYLRVGNQYFLKDAPYQLAFEDLGPYLITQHNRPDVVESMVDMVAAKSWRRVRVSGHEAFRSEVWLQATLLSIEVGGYVPKAADLARLADARQAHLGNRIEADASMPATGTQSPAAQAPTPAPAPAPENGPPAKASGVHMETHGAVDVAARPTSADPGDHARSRRSEPPLVGDEPETPRQYAGELREHGRAPYLHNPARSDSYYVVFSDARGADRVVWGVDLERAVLASRAEPGQHIKLENQGRRLVTVKVPVLDDHGMAVGEEEKDVYRNTWQVDVAQRERSSTESATRPGRAGIASAPASTSGQDARQERQQAAVSDEDKVLHLAVLAGAMREQGFSARSIARVQQRAEQMLDAFGQEGIGVPRPRVFDPKAPSERERRARPAAGRAPEREIARTPAEPSPAR